MLFDFIIKQNALQLEEGPLFNAIPGTYLASLAEFLNRAVLRSPKAVE